MVQLLSFGRVRQILKREQVLKFFSDMHVDFQELAADKRLLISPLIWGAVLIPEG
jgi:hypothetical protein